MVRTLVALGQLPPDSLKEKGKKLVVPEEIENLFRYFDAPNISPSTASITIVLV